MSRALRICFVCYRGNMQSGGQGVYLWFLARELARLGHAVDVLVGPPYPDPMPFAREVARLPNERFWGKWFFRDWKNLLPKPNPLRVFEPLNFWEFGASAIGFLPEPFAFSVRAFREIAARLRSGRRYDLVHDVQCLGYGLLGVRALGVPVVTTVHHPLSVDRRMSFKRDRSLREALGTWEFYPVEMQGFVARRLNRVFTSSLASARQIEADFGVRPARLVMLANGIDCELFSPDPSAPRAESELLCVARASDPNKGVRVLLEALARLPAHVRVTLVDDAKSEALAWAAKLGVADRLSVTGRLDTPELVRLYRRATLVVVPSRYEGFGLPAAEAMACGTPVVATSAGALPEVVSTGGGGVLAPVDDAAALADEIAALLAAPSLRAELGARGRAGVLAAYAWPSIAARTLQEYERVIAERRPALTRSES
ncbi:MAG TPA: glycosyltransferase family 4 protein [Myxococcota bacterium]|jgi:glycosyltransferase involved in cell wall biosynthesis